jgi:CheY-like chemotaxis protein
VSLMARRLAVSPLLLAASPYGRDEGAGEAMGMPSRAALQAATEAMARQYIMPETMTHPAVQALVRKLAYMIMAYGLVPSTPAEQPVKQDQPQAVERPGKQPRHYVLLVDDVTDVLVSVGAFLVNAGYAVQKASNGDQALQLIANDPRIDVLVTDFAMPGLNGVELIAQAVQMRPSLKALVITGYPNADGLAELPPNTAVLCKPFRRDTLIANVDVLVGETQAAEVMAERADRSLSGG